MTGGVSKARKLSVIPPGGPKPPVWGTRPNVRHDKHTFFVQAHGPEGELIIIPLTLPQVQAFLKEVELWLSASA